jgi:hypothetical protein
LKIREKLERWLLSEYDEQKMLWVCGSVGTGKSAVAQSFGDFCEEKGNLGGSYFFSRTANRNNFETVVPTLVYSLATTIPEYRTLVGQLLDGEPHLLQKAPPVQFLRLIVEPLANIRRPSPQKPIVIILDGFDECEGEDAQQEMLKLIKDAVLSKLAIPLRWLIFSRPEAHLQNAFSKVKICQREELVIDAECRENVERYVKDELIEIKGRYKDVTPAEWPSQDQLQALIDTASGFFIFASTCLKYISNTDEANPSSRLNSLLTFTSGSPGVASINPLDAVDSFYSQILEKIQPIEYQTTRRILAYTSHQNKLDKHKYLDSVQALCNFLRLDQQAFYRAARGLYSVMSIPEPDGAANAQLQFYHVSFQDFLLDPSRSGDFFIGEQEALGDIVQSSIYWCQVDVTHFHTDDGKPDLGEFPYGKRSYSFQGGTLIPMTGMVIYPIWLGHLKTINCRLLNQSHHTFNFVYSTPILIWN